MLVKLMLKPLVHRQCVNAQMLTCLISGLGFIFSLINTILYVYLYPKYHLDYSSLVSIPSIEREFILSYLNRSHTMIEYGSGYSTLYFSQYVRSFYSIEHDPEWFQHIQKLISYSPDSYRSIKRYILAPVQLGDRGWPGGSNEGNYDQFKSYIHAVEQFQIKEFDRVLIDGRARLNCLKEIHRYLHSDSIVFIHGHFQTKLLENLIKKLYEKVFQTHHDHPLLALRPILQQNISLSI